MNKPQTISSFIINNKDVLCNEFSKETVKNWIYARRSPNKTAKGKIIVAKKMGIEVVVEKSSDAKKTIRKRHQLDQITFLKKIREARVEVVKNIEKIKSKMYKELSSIPEPKFDGTKNITHRKNIQRWYRKQIREISTIKHFMEKYNLTTNYAKILRSLIDG